MNVVAKDVIAAKKTATPEMIALAGAGGTVLVLLLLAALLAWTGDDFRVLVLNRAREVTGASATGMAASAWLIVMLPAWAVWLGLRLGRRLHPAAMVGWAAATALLAVPVVAFSPGRQHLVEDLVAGPGAAGFATGLRWSGWAVLALAGAYIWLNLGPSGQHSRPRELPVSSPLANALIVAGISMTALIIAILRTN